MAFDKRLSRYFIKLLFLAILLPETAISFPGSTCSQQQHPIEERESGIALYEKGAYEEAARELTDATKREKDNLTAWHYLALSLEKLGRLKEARKAHEKTAKLGDLLITAQVSKPIGTEYELLLASINPVLKFAAASSRRYIELSGMLSNPDLDEWSIRADYLSDFVELFNPSLTASGTVLSGTKVTTKARIVSKPEPQYPDEARERRTTGDVKLFLVFARDGRVRAIFPLRSLPNGLTASAIRAARQVRFTPAAKDGQPVSLLAVVEYNFRVY